MQNTETGTRRLRILHLEDKPRDAEIVSDKLEFGGLVCNIFVVSEKAGFEAALDGESFDLIMCDHSLPGYDGITALKRAQIVQPDVPVILISGTVADEQAVKCLRLGATDYLLKQNLERLVPAVQRALQEAETRRSRKQLAELIESRRKLEVEDGRKRAVYLEQHAAALLRSEERTNYALRAAGIGIWELDLATQKLMWSETMAPHFGLTPAQAPGTLEAFLMLIHADDRAVIKDSLSQSVRKKVDFDAEFRVESPDGVSRWVAARARLVRDIANQPVRWLGVATDISERRALEGQFRQAQKMEAVGQLAGGMAHDFNNLLTVILGYSDFVVQTLAADDPRRIEMAEIISAGQRAAGLTMQLLAFSRKQVLQPSTVDLNSLVTGLRPMLSRLIGEHVDLVATLAPDLCAIRADRGQLEQVLMNLAVNGRDAMPLGGRLVIETANVELDGSFIQDVTVVPGAYVMLAVSDSGIGMDEKTKKRLFEPFFTTKGPGKGTGLGLATVYGIVKQSGGHLWVYSEIGKGATFKVYLPCIDGDEEVELSSTLGEVGARGTETVLIVEDEYAVRSLTRAILERAGYCVFDAPNPQQALELFMQNRDLFALLVTDVIMPGSSGPKLFGQLSLQQPDLKVLYVSGYTDDTIVHQGELDPGIEFLQKPFTADSLTRRVRHILDTSV